MSFHGIEKPVRAVPKSKRALTSMTAAASLAKAETIRESPHASEIDAINDERLKRAAVSLVAGQLELATMSTTLMTAHHSAVDEMDAAFEKKSDDRIKAKVVLKRAMRVAERAHATMAELDGEVHSFLAQLFFSRQANTAEHRKELAAAFHLLDKSRSDHDYDLARLQACVQHAEQNGIRKAVRLGLLWSADKQRGDAEMHMLTNLFVASLEEAEDRWRRDVNRYDIEITALRNEHANALARERAERARDAACARAALNAETNRCESFQAALEMEREKRASESTRLRAEIDARDRALHATRRELQETAQLSRRELEQREATWQAQLKARDQSARGVRNELSHEVQRLRDVQENVLQKAGCLPGGEARQLLFYESLKSRTPRHDTSLTWRGQTERPAPHNAQAMPTHHLPSSIGAAPSPFSMKDHAAAERARPDPRTTSRTMASGIGWTSAWTTTVRVVEDM